MLPKMLLLSLLSVPAATALYVKQNPEWNPPMLADHPQWLQFRELVLGPEADTKQKQKAKPTGTGPAPTASKSLSSGAVALPRTGTAKPSSSKQPPAGEASKSPEQLSAMISNSNGTAATKAKQEKPAAQVEALKKRATKKLTKGEVMDEAGRPVKQTEKSVAKKTQQAARDTAGAAVAASGTAVTAANATVAEPNQVVDKKVDEATMKEKAAIGQLSDEASAAAMGKKVESQIQATTKDILDALRSESDAAADEMDKNYLQGLKDLDANALVIRVAQLATEMKHRSKWEAVRLVEALRRMEDEAQKKTSEILKKQEQLHKEVLERELRLQKELMDRRTREEMTKLKKDYEKDLASAITAHKTKVSNELRAAFEKDKKAIEDHFDRQLQAKSVELQETLAKERKERLEELEGFRAQLRTLNDVLDSSSTYEAFSHQVHKTSVAALALSDRIEAAAPLRNELRALREAARSDPFIEAAIRTLPRSVIDEGAASVSQLQDRFKNVRRVGRRAAMVPRDSGLVGQLFSGALSYLIIPPGGPIEGSDAEAIFSRAEYALKAGDIERAVEEMKGLNGLAAEVCQDWIQAAESRLAVEQTAKVVKAHVALLAASCS